MKIVESENFKAFFVYLLICCGVLNMGVIFAKIFAPKPQPPVTTINHYFVGNKEVNYGTVQLPDGN